MTSKGIACYSVLLHLSGANAGGEERCRFGRIGWDCLGASIGRCKMGWKEGVVGAKIEFHMLYGVDMLMRQPSGSWLRRVRCCDVIGQRDERCTVLLYHIRNKTCIHIPYPNFEGLSSLLPVVDWIIAHDLLEHRRGLPPPAGH